MLDINKELEKFNRLLEDMEDDADRTDSAHDAEGHAEEVSETASDSTARVGHDAVSRAEAVSTGDGSQSSGATPAHRTVETEKPTVGVQESGASETEPSASGPEETKSPHEITDREQEELDLESVRRLDTIPKDVRRRVPSAPPPQHVTGFDSLIKGARSALTDSHRAKPKSRPPVTVTLPSPEELEEDLVRESGMRERLGPMVTEGMDYLHDRMTHMQDGMAVLQDRMGVVVGVAAAVVLIAASLVIVPRMLSGDELDPVEVASATTESDSVHLLSSAESMTESDVASLTVSTFPPGARVYLGSELIGVTPFQGISVDRGFQAITIRKADYLPVDTILTIDGAESLFFELSTDPAAQLVMEVDPSLEPMRDFPVIDESSSSASRRVDDTPSVVEQPTESNPQRSREVERSSRERGEAARSATGSVVITSDPAGATVFFDDVAMGETPMTLTEISAGRKRVSMQRDGYVPYEIELTVMPSLQTPFHAVLAPMKGRLEVRTSGGADMYVDGVLVQRAVPAGYATVVDVGERDIRLVHPQFGAWSTNVTIRPDETTPIEVDLKEVGYTSAVEEGDRMFAESRYAEAIESYNRALSIRPGSQAIEHKMGLAAKAMTEPATPSADASGVYSVVDTPPELIGGLEALHARVEYPEEAYNAGVQGRVYVQFVVNEAGRAENVTIARGLPMGCNEAAIRAVQRSRFTPGLLDGTPVKVRQTLFVNFTIN